MCCKTEKREESGTRVGGKGYNRVGKFGCP